MLPLRTILLTAALGVALAGPASAVSFSFLTYENADGADLDGLNLWFEVTDGGSYADFTFYNSSTIASNVAIIFFEANGAGLDLGGSSIFAESANVDFDPGSSPANPAPGMGWAGTLASFGAVPPPAHNGIGNTTPPTDPEWLTIRFDYGSSDFASLIADLESGDFRVAQHVTGLPQSIWTISTPDTPTDPVPLPATVWLLGSGLIGWAGSNRLRRRSK